jgi:hypothetical protein
MFEKEQFVEGCKAASLEGQKAVREIVLEAMSDPSGIVKALGEPVSAGINPLYRGEDLTIINFVWAPYMTLMPHNHNMSAVVGIYYGREDNMFWRRIGGGADPGPDIEAAGAESLGAGQVASLGRDIIHSVANPISKFTSAIHVYSGDFFDPPEDRAQWDHDTLLEEPWDIEAARNVFAEAEARYKAGI